MAEVARRSRSQEPAEQRLSAMAEVARSRLIQEPAEQRQHRAETQSAGDQRRRLRLNDAVERWSTFYRSHDENAY